MGFGTKLTVKNGKVESLLFQVAVAVKEKAFVPILEKDILDKEQKNMLQGECSDDLGATVMVRVIQYFY